MRSKANATALSFGVTVAVAALALPWSHPILKFGLGAIAAIALFLRVIS